MSMNVTEILQHANDDGVHVLGNLKDGQAAFWHGKISKRNKRWIGLLEFKRFFR